MFDLAGWHVGVNGTKTTAASFESALFCCAFRDRWHLHQPKAVRAWRRDHPRNGYETFLWHQAGPLGRWGEGLICGCGRGCWWSDQPTGKGRSGLWSSTHCLAVTAVRAVACMADCILKICQATLWLLQPHRLWQSEWCDLILAPPESLGLMFLAITWFFLREMYSVPTTRLELCV